MKLLQRSQIVGKVEQARWNNAQKKKKIWQQIDWLQL